MKKEIQKGKIVTDKEVQSYLRDKFGMKVREIDPNFVRKMNTCLLWTILSDHFVYLPSLIFMPRMKAYRLKVKYIDDKDKFFRKRLRSMGIKSPVPYKTHKFA